MALVHLPPNGPRKNSPIFEGLEALPGEFDAYPVSAQIPRDKLEKYRDAAMDFYQNGQLSHSVDPSQADSYGMGAADTSMGSLAKILAEAPEPLTPREPVESISRGEFEELTAKLRNVDNHTSRKDRSWCYRCQLGLRWYHVVLAVIINDIILIAVGASVGSAFYSIEPLKDGSFRAQNIEVEGLQIDPDHGSVRVLLESKDRDAELALVSFAGESAAITMTDASAPAAEVFTMLSVQEHQGAQRALRLKQGTESRLSVVHNGNGTDVRLDPDLLGKVVVKGGMGLDVNRIDTQNASLELVPAMDRDIVLQPSGRGAVVINEDLTLSGSTVSTQASALLLKPQEGSHIVMSASAGGIVEIVGPLNQSGGNVWLQSNLTVQEVSAERLFSRNGVRFDANAIVGDEVSDAIDFNGHIKSCGTSSIERYFCDQSKLVFDANDDGKSLILYVQDPQTLDPLTNRNYEITFPVETGTVLTSVSKDSKLIRVGDLEEGSLVYGFGAAEVASLTSRGASNLFGDCTIGISRDNLINLKGHLAEEQLQFDFNSDGVRYIMRVPDPSKDKDDMDCYISTGSTAECVRLGLMKTQLIDFPMETGTILTDVSKVSQLEVVGNLHTGSLLPGFGAATVSDLSVAATGFSNLASNVRLGATSSNTLEIEARILNENLVFDANSDGKSMSIWIPDPIVSQTIYFPERSGELLTDTSTYSVLTQVGALETGSIVDGFGPIHAESFKSTGDAILYDDVKLGDVDTDVVEINGHIVTHEFYFDANSDKNRFTLHFPDPPAGTPSRHIEFPLEDGTVLTTTSLRSNLTEVAALHQGSLVAGFGSATVTDLTATGDSELKGNVKLCSSRADLLTLNGRLLDTQLVVAHPLAQDVNYKLSFPRVTDDTNIKFPLEEHAGTLLTDRSKVSSLTSVASLTAGAIEPGFGSIQTTEMIAGSSVTSTGLLRGLSNAEFGSQPDDRVSLRATLEVRGAAPNGTLMTTFSVDPRNGDVFVKGVLSVQSAISALAAPFFVDTIHASTLVELVEDQGINIEGLVFKDGGFPFAKTDAVEEFTDGQGVSVEGVTMKDGALTAEATVAGTSPIGNIDLVTLINEGRDFMMAGAHTSIKFRQWHQGIPDNESFASDSGAITVGTEDNWRADLQSRNAFMGFSTVEGGQMVERVHIAANGDLIVNDGQLISFESTGNLFVAGNVSIGENQEGARSVLVQSEDQNSTISVRSKMQEASISIQSGVGHPALLAVVSGANQEAIVRLQDPAPEMAGSVFDFVLDGSVAKKRRLGDGTIVPESCNAIDSNACAAVSLVGNPGQTPNGLCVGATGLNCVYQPPDLVNNVPEACLAAQASTCANVALDGNPATCTNVPGCEHTPATVQAVHTMRLTNAYNEYNCKNVTTVVGILNPINVTNEVCQWQQSSPITIFEATSDPEQRLGNVAVSGQLSSLTANIEMLLEARNAKVHADTQLGDSIDDRITLLGSLAHENVTVKLRTGGNTLTLQFPDPSLPQLLTFPDESGSVLSSASNFSTLTAVSELTVGSIGKGFGHAEVASLGAEGDIQSKGEIIFGDEPADGVSIQGHFRETQFIFDPNSDFLTTTLVVTDPSPQLPSFSHTCQMVNGTALKVEVPWLHDDFRKFRWTDASLTVDDAIVALTEEVVNLFVVPIDENTTSLLLEGKLCVASDKDICAAAPLGGNPTGCQGAGSCVYTPEGFDIDGNVIVESCAATFLQVCAAVDMSQSTSTETCRMSTGCTVLNISRTIEDVNCAYECADSANASTCSFNDGSVDPQSGLTKEVKTLRDVMLQYMFNEIIARQALGMGHVIKFPNADGTLLHKFNGSTHLDGNVFVGKDRADSVVFNGVINGGVRVEGQVEGRMLSCTNKPLYWTVQTCEEVVPDILAIGAATCNDFWSILGISGENTMIGDWCPHQCYPRCSAPGSALRFVNKDMNQESCVATHADICAGVALNGNAATCTNEGNCTHTPASPGVAEACTASYAQSCADVVLDGNHETCIEVTGCSYVPERKSGEELILAVPEYTTSQVLTLPDNSGTLLSSASSYSSLNTLGVLNALTVAGPSRLNGETHVGESRQGNRSLVYMAGAVMQQLGEPSMSFGSSLYKTQYVSGCDDWGVCIATDATACGNVPLVGNPLANKNACEGGVLDCVYTPADAANGVSQSCTATKQQVCHDIILTTVHPLSVCESVPGCTHTGVCVIAATETYTNLTHLSVVHESTGPRANQLNGDQTVTLPYETGTIITSGSDFRVITGLGAVEYGSLGPGFGAAHVSELRVTGGAYLDGNISTIGSEASDQISMLGTIIGSDALRFEGLVDDSFDLTLSQPVFTQARTIFIPDEDGRLLTTTSNVSRLLEVGALEVGTIVEGFGGAHVQSLVVTDSTVLRGNVQLGDDFMEDAIEIQGYVSSQQIKFDTDGIGGSMSLMVTDPPTDDVTIRFPAYDGSVVLDTTRITGITGTGALDLGSITEGFGPITVGMNGGIATTNGQPIVASGDLKAEGATIFSHTGVPASDNIIIPEDKTLVRITPGNADRLNYYTLPDGEAGELLVVQNDDNMQAYPLDEGLSQNIPPSDTAVFFHVGYRWVEISRLLEWRLDGSSLQKLPFVAAEKRLTASDGLYWDNAADHMSIKSSNDNAKLSLESFGSCPGFLQHEPECRSHTSAFSFMLNPTEGVEIGTEMVPLQLKVRHEYGDPIAGHAIVSSAVDAATCGAISVGPDAGINQAACEDATQCVYTSDNSLTPANEENCGGGDACAAARLLGEACYATDQAGCAAVVLNGTSAPCTGAIGLDCTYTPANLHIGIAEACVATKSSVCTAISVAADSTSCTNEAGCSYTNNEIICTGTTKCTYVADVASTAEDEAACVASNYNVAVPTAPEACLAIDIDACAALVPASNPLVCTDSNLDCVYTAADPGTGAVEACTATRVAACQAVKLNGYPATCTSVAGCRHVPASGATAFKTVERTLLSMGDEQGFVVSDMNITLTPTTAMSVRDLSGHLDLISVNVAKVGHEKVSVHAPALDLSAATWPNDSIDTCATVNLTGTASVDAAACVAAGSCVYSAAAQSCEPVCDPCACDNDGIVSGFNTGRPRCDYHYAGDAPAANAVALDWNLMELDSSRTFLQPTDLICMVHPDCKHVAGIISSHTGGTRDLPYRICAQLEDNARASDCNDPATEATMADGWQDETLVHGNMRVTASQMTIQRKVVNYMQGRKSRSLTNVMSFSNDGSLALAGSTTDLTASESFTIYTPADTSSRRRLSSNITRGKTVFGLQNLQTVGAETASLAVRNLTIEATGITTLMSDKVTFSDSEGDVFVIDKAAGMRIANVNSADRSITVVTGTTTFRGVEDDRDVLKLVTSVPGQETLILNTPIMNLDTRTTMQDGVRKYGGAMTIATKSTILQTTNSLGQSVPMLTAEDAGIDCDVFVDVWTGDKGKTSYFTVDFDSAQNGLGAWGDYVGPYRIQLALPAGEHFLTHYTSQCAAAAECSEVLGVCAGDVPNSGCCGASNPLGGQAATTGCSSCTTCEPLNYGWYGGRVRVSDAAGNTINSGAVSVNPQCTTLSGNVECSGAIHLSGTRTYFNVGADGQCERVELRMQAEYTSLSDRSGTTPYLTIDAQDALVSGHQPFLSLSAPIVRAGETNSIVAVNGKQVKIQAGGVDAMVLTNTATICSAVILGPTNPEDDCLAVRVTVGDTTPACAYTPPSSGLAHSCRPAAWADMSVDMKVPVVFTDAAVFNGAITMAKGTETVDFMANALTLSNPETCEAIDASFCAGIALDNNEATCTVGSPAHNRNCAYTARVLVNGVQTVAEKCYATHQAACTAVALDGIPATCTSVSGCKHTPPSGTVKVDSERTKIFGQDILIQGKCADDPSTSVSSSSTFTFYAAHCASVPVGGTGWKQSNAFTKTNCDANANLYWIESQCVRDDDTIVESGRTAFDCTLRKQSVTECIASCSDPQHTDKSSCEQALATWSPGPQVRLSANTVSLQADGMDLIRLSAARADPSTEPARKHGEVSAWGDAAASDETEVYLTADVIRARNKVDNDNILYISTTSSTSTVILSAETIRVGTKFYATPRYVWFNGDGSASDSVRNAQTGMCIANTAGGPQEDASKLEPACGAAGAAYSWQPSTCTRLSDNVQVETNHAKSACDARNSAQQTVTVEGNVVTLDAADEVRLTATNGVKVLTDFHATKNVAFSSAEVAATEEIVVSADTTMLLVTEVTGQQQNALSLARISDGADVGNVLMIYNDDDDPLTTSSGNVPAKSAAMLYRTSIGWVLWESSSVNVIADSG